MERISHEPSAFGPDSVDRTTWRIDLHVHTRYSDDSRTSLDQVISAVARAKLDGLAIAYHDVITGALDLKAKAPFPVIVAEEITTTEGDLIGLFLQEWIPPGLSPAETARLIRRQNGLVYVPHPFDRLRKSALRSAGIMPILGLVDAVEALNSRVLWPADNDKALRFATEHGIPRGAGSDAHTPAEIGMAYVEMSPFSTPTEFLESLNRGRLGGGISTPLVHLSSTWARFLERPGS